MRYLGEFGVAGPMNLDPNHGCRGAIIEVVNVAIDSGYLDKSFFVMIRIAASEANGPGRALRQDEWKLIGNGLRH